MAISIDTVYQKVLALANKEQRGYITPQEFNLFADQAQKEIFEQYFYDTNQWSRQHGNDTGHSDMLDKLEQKISMFEKYSDGPNAKLSNEYGDLYLEDNDNFPDIYKLLEVYVGYGNGHKVAEEVTLKEFRRYRDSNLTKASKNRPLFLHYAGHANGNRIKIYPFPTAVTTGNGVLGTDGVEYSVVVSYIRKPNNPKWGYVVVDDKALYNDNISVDFELHSSEESELVYRILALAGIAIKQPDLLSSAITLESAKVQQEKQ